jgi:hypothetical protein
VNQELCWEQSVVVVVVVACVGSFSMDHVGNQCFFEPCQVLFQLQFVTQHLVKCSLVLIDCCVEGVGQSESESESEMLLFGWLIGQSINR